MFEPRRKPKASLPFLGELRRAAGKNYPGREQNCRPANKTFKKYYFFTRLKLNR